jgi:hypothetical protein
MAFNAVGWNMGQIPKATFGGLLGADTGFVELPLVTSADLKNSGVKASGNITVLAREALGISSLISNTADLTGSASVVLSMAASGMLASNRVRTETRAYANSKGGADASPNNLSLSGNLTVSAVDDADISARIDMSSSVGAGAVVGALVTRNDVRNDVVALVEDARIQARGDVLIRVMESASIEARLKGEVRSGGASSSTYGLAANGMVATNMILSTANAKLLNSTLYSDGRLDVLADNLAAIVAENRSTMLVNGVAVGVSMAFNTIGWQAQSALTNSLAAFWAPIWAAKCRPAPPRWW